MKNSIVIFMLLLVVSMQGKAQVAQKDWPIIPGLDPASPLSLTSQETFIAAVGLAALSYTLAEVILKNQNNTNFYQLRAGMNKEYAWGLKNVWHQNFGVEHRVASWFALAAELNLQEFYDKTPGLSSKEKFGLGAGLMTYYRWYLFGKKQFSPYFEYGTGLFFGFQKFPYNGTQFTFNHSTQIGLEYTLQNQSKLRVGYGNFHQSNNGWLDSNPGYEGNGFSVTYAWPFK